MTTDSKNLKIDEESKKTMLKELAIINGSIPDDDNKIDNLDDYFSGIFLFTLIVHLVEALSLQTISLTSGHIILNHFVIVQYSLLF